MIEVVDPGSFRDPSGFVFTRESTLYRQVQNSYRENYLHLMESGLYQSLVDLELLVSHVEEIEAKLTSEAFRILRPERIPFISYTYEWCFSQLKDAALATLQIQKEALRFGMTLKDANAYNIQFYKGKPILIDTLSFEKYADGSPWVAYRQFCQHFLAPLALMSLTDVRLGRILLRSETDGVPLDLASRLLPIRTKLNAGLLMHIHLHSASQKKHEGKSVTPPAQSGKMSKMGLLGLIDSLESAVRKLSWKPTGTEWADYYNQTNYSGESMDAKRKLVSEMLSMVTPELKTVWDLGANTGMFSRLAAAQGALTVAWDIDPAAVEKNYQSIRESKEQSILPLIQDLTNPSPDLGWDLMERSSLKRRGPANVVMALALVHHLAIGNNVPLNRIASFFQSVGEWLVVEFVPKTDSMVQRLLASREDIFTDYTQDGFERAFRQSFQIVHSALVPGSQRTLYLMRGIFYGNG